jgi:hypothetical protein
VAQGEQHTQSKFSVKIAKEESQVSQDIERGSDWIKLRGVDRLRVSEARLQAHHATQWLARAARAFIAPRADDGHTSLGWDPIVRGFTTYPLRDGSWLSLKIVDLTIALYSGEQDGRMRSFSLNRHTDSAARQWLGEQFNARGFDAQALDTPPPYEIPAHAVSLGKPYDSAGLTDALAELAAWFGNAAISLGAVQRQMIERGCAVSPVRCWPHHFDIATLTTLPAKIGSSTRYIGAGLSPGDEYYDVPYFYVSVYPKPDPQLLPTLPMLGHWHERDFMAAIATAPRILGAKNQMAETDDFLRAAIAAAIKVLS